MTRNEIIELIFKLSKQSEAFHHLQIALADTDYPTLSRELFDCGIIPEEFAHDSSDEKLWAKYCDIILNLSFNYLGIPSQVLRTRGNSADVFGKTDDYSIVADAKAFRLSRTAKNQKDFKVTALDDWRGSDTYACLVAPLYQYPSTSSQIYTQAIARRVTLLSYIHLKFLLDYRPVNPLEILWQTPQSIPATSKAQDYWQAIDTNILKITEQKSDKLEAYKKQELAVVSDIGNQALGYWQSTIEQYHMLTKEEAVERLIDAEKIPQKIANIQQTLARVGGYFG